MKPRSIRLVRYSRLLKAHARALFVVCVGAFLQALLVMQSDAAPIINSISPISNAFNPAADQSIQTITITGSGFGTQAPYTGNSSDIVFLIVPAVVA